MENYRMLYLTVADRESGRKLARRIVEQRLAACAHLFPVGDSFYWWQNELSESAEAVIVAKTRADLVAIAIETIASWHDYQVPCILSLPIEAGHQPFLDWISQETREA